MNYGLVDSGSQSINGGIAKSETAEVLVYLEVQDPPSTCAGSPPPAATS